MFRKNHNKIKLAVIVMLFLITLMLNYIPQNNIFARSAHLENNIGEYEQRSKQQSCELSSSLWISFGLGASVCLLRVGWKSNENHS
ncbi:hypothetical protein I5677_15065 [Mobilitalea sibirica]|uniref:Uncharacterized protein n=1 Tax=Mobilitalea sibirica TaxID=1462919 RepID=A0A8J7H0X3_9FIRM|nr:hypothetical protein [Mobilitalea sibirica]MBH1942219.1 hypothetical protein [Mobilitalea sibirica]